MIDLTYIFYAVLLYLGGYVAGTMDERSKTVCPNCNGTGEIQCGHPDNARPCDCQIVPTGNEIPY